jgi:hypothetical protein
MRITVMPNVSRVTLADVVTTPTLVDGLIAAGETEVERKQDLPTDGLAPTVASFANTDGGWILLGVDNPGKPVGYQWKDHVRDHLSGDIDPMPPFALAAVQHKGVTVGVIRVAPSSDAPHLVTKTGVLYVRVPGGKAPVADRRTLLELAQRARDAEETARYRRLHNLPLVEVPSTHVRVRRASALDEHRHSPPRVPLAAPRRATEHSILAGQQGAARRPGSSSSGTGRSHGREHARRRRDPSSAVTRGCRISRRRPAEACFPATDLSRRLPRSR